jgi:hypothetical protein
MKSRISAAIVLALALALTAAAAREFLRMRTPEPIVAGKGVSETRRLSDWFPGLAGGPGDTPVYVLRGRQPGGRMLVLGGTHPNEPAGFVSAVLLVEAAVPLRGDLYVIPRANASGFTHNDPQEGAPQRFEVRTAGGARWFRYGSRATNPVHQWPDPEIYIHASSGQTLSGNETRNLNRGYPGLPGGTLTERVCFGITELVRRERIDLTVDLHEASPEYPVINAIVAHPNAMAIASRVVLGLEMDDITIKLEPSPVNLRGLSHRELGDHTDTMSVLMETANASQGRLRGRTDARLVLEGRDPYYLRAAAMKRLFVPYDEKGHPLEERVGRHVAGIVELARALTATRPDRGVVLDGLPGYDAILEHGVGTYLAVAP